MNSTLVGAKVITADGQELGKVKELDGECIKIDAPMQPDYWLAADVIDLATPAVVQLLIAKDDIGDAIDNGREHSGHHVHRAM
jgi:hypothetical protein